MSAHPYARRPVEPEPPKTPFVVIAASMVVALAGVLTALVLLT